VGQEGGRDSPVDVSSDGREHVAIRDVVDRELEVALDFCAANKQRVLPSPLAEEDISDRRRGWHG